MKYSMLLSVMLLAGALSACDKPEVESSTTVIAVPGPAGPTGATGAAGEAGAIEAWIEDADLGGWVVARRAKGC